MEHDPIRRFVRWATERRADSVHCFPFVGNHLPLECCYCREGTCEVEVRLKPMSLPFIVHDRRLFN